MELDELISKQPSRILPVYFVMDGEPFKALPKMRSYYMHDITKWWLFYIRKPFCESDAVIADAYKDASSAGRRKMTMQFKKALAKELELRIFKDNL